MLGSAFVGFSLGVNVRECVCGGCVFGACMCD